MATYYVGAGGSDSNNGTSYATRFLTLAKAATSVSAGGDIVYVAPGTYREEITLTVSGGNSYSTGTVTVTNGSTTVTGSGTDFTTADAVQSGYYFKCPNAGAIKIAQVNSATELILDQPFDGASASGLSFMTFNPIKWIGDYEGTNTDGVGGLVRITGSADDISITRSNCIVSSGVDFNLISGFAFDLATRIINLTNPEFWIIEKCSFDSSSLSNIIISGADQKGVTIQNIYSSFGTSTGYNSSGTIYFFHTSQVLNTYHIVQNSIFTNTANNSTSGTIAISRVDRVLVKNSNFISLANAIAVHATGVNTLTTVNNCGFYYCIIALIGAATTGIIVEDYNNFYGNATNRANVTTGSNSISRVPLFEIRWFFEMTK